MERSTDKAKLAKLTDIDLLLDDKQSDELSNVISKIEETRWNAESIPGSR